MRVLCLLDEYPWPARSGYRQRLSQVVRALTELGEVDLFCAVQPGNPAGSPPAGVSLARSLTYEVSERRRGPRLVLGTLADRRPRRIAWRNWSDAGATLHRWAQAPYDLVWCGHADAYEGLASAGSMGRAVVVDLDNLEDWALAARLRSKAGRHVTVRGRAVALLDRLDVGRWRRLQARIADEAAAVVVCSDLDRRRLGHDAAVIPNGYETSAPPAITPPPGAVLVMVGLFVYPHNHEAATYFVEEILPRVHAQLPAVELRLVGRHEGALDHLGRHRGVTVVGEVDDVTVELAKARATVIPLRGGSGTRIKVLEAFALGLPVVSTTVGCEGIDAEPGKHLLVADNPSDFAAACVDLLRDDALWHRLNAAGRDLYGARYRWSDIRPQIAALARRAAQEGG